jgi:hypothetical protein
VIVEIMVGVSITIIIMVVVVRETVIVISLFVVMAASLAGSGFTLEQPPAIIVVFVADVIAIVVKVDVDSGTVSLTIPSLEVIEMTRSRPCCSTTTESLPSVPVIDTIRSAMLKSTLAESTSRPSSDSTRRDDSGVYRRRCLVRLKLFMIRVLHENVLDACHAHTKC